MFPREVTIENERVILSEKACRSENSRGRARYEEPCPVRTDFQRDRDRIIHCEAFRRLKHKTQVFLSPHSDHYRTRLTHTLEVAQIARTIARALRLNEDLTEAIALGHDLGHTPFGHDGEYILNELMKETGGFAHNEQSVRVVDVVERAGTGLNLTAEVRDGIINHNNDNAFTLEGNVVHISDRIAYVNHDIEDAVLAGVISKDDLPEDSLDVLGHTKSQRITTLINSLILNSDKKIRYDELTENAFKKLRGFMFSNVYHADITNKEKFKSRGVLKSLFNYYTENPRLLPGFYSDIASREGAFRGAVDYIAGMSDNHAVEAFNEIFVPKMWK